MARFVTVARVGEIPPGTGKTVAVKGRHIGVFNCSGEHLAVDALCTHAEALLHEGTLDCGAGTVECWLHGAEFDLRSGDVVRGPATEAVATYPVRVVDGQVQVGLPDAEG